MMSSAIPVRLEFACGHSAMTTLARIKGETAAQRTERIAREKSAATLRNCDFCPPRVVVDDVEETPGEAVATALADAALVVVDELLGEAPGALEEADGEAAAADGRVEPVTLVETVPLVEPVGIVEPVGVGETVAGGEPVVVVEPARAAAPRPRVGRRRAAAARPAAKQAVARSRRFEVRYHAEAVVEADSIDAALRQAEALGATDIIRITRV